MTTSIVVVVPPLFNFRLTKLADRIAELIQSVFSPFLFIRMESIDNGNSDLVLTVELAGLVNKPEDHNQVETYDTLSKDLNLEIQKLVSSKLALIWCEKSLLSDTA